MQEKKDQSAIGSYYDVSEFGIPWGSNPQLRQLAQENDVDYEDFMECLKCSMTPEEISQELDIKVETADMLTKAFFENGLVSNLMIDQKKKKKTNSLLAFKKQAVCL